MVKVTPLIVASTGMDGYHRRVWGSATSGPFRVAEVAGATHLDLLGYRASATGKILADWLAERAGGAEGADR